jgi:hypothetical protein
MNRLLARLCRPGMSSRCARTAICAIWIGLAGVFAWLALEASGTIETKLPRSGFRIPVSHNVQIGNLRFQEVINSLAERYDQTASQCEQSIRRSAWRNVWLNLIATVLSLLGFGAQWQMGHSLETVGSRIDGERVAGHENGQFSASGAVSRCQAT